MNLISGPIIMLEEIYHTIILQKHCVINLSLIDYLNAGRASYKYIFEKIFLRANSYHTNLSWVIDNNKVHIIYYDLFF